MCVHTPEAACSRAASSAGIGRVVTFTTSLLTRSCTHSKSTQVRFTHKCFNFFRVPPPHAHLTSSFTHLLCLPCRLHHCLTKRHQYHTSHTCSVTVTNTAKTQTLCAYPHVPLPVDDEQCDGAELNQVLPLQCKPFSVQEGLPRTMEYSYRL